MLAVSHPAVWWLAIPLAILAIWDFLHHGRLNRLEDRVEVLESDDGRWGDGQ